jgi:para-nitrobenzyl esterase
VSLGYRLGVEGFLEIDGAPSNRAVLDWIAGLQWVQDNIEGFGGDPSNVTIGGQSAGSAACLTLMVNPAADGLFKRVIGMSGTSDSRMPREAATELGVMVAKHLGVEASVEDLSKFTPLELVDAHIAVAGSAFSRESLMSGFDPKAPALRPYADGETIPEHPFLAIKEGKGGARELLSGSTECELNGLIRMQKAQLSEEQVLRGLTAMTVEGDSLKRYKDELGTDDIYEVFGQVATDRAFREPLDRLLDDHANTGAATYGYQFTWPSPLFDGMVGSAHCLDIPFAFDLLGTDSVNNSLVGPDAPRSLADAMHGAFVSFIKTGDPGFERYDSGSRRMMRFDAESTVVSDPLKLQREVLGGR